MSKTTIVTTGTSPPCRNSLQRQRERIFNLVCGKVESPADVLGLHGGWDCELETARIGDCALGMYPGEVVLEGLAAVDYIQYPVSDLSPPPLDIGYWVLDTG